MRFLCGIPSGTSQEVRAGGTIWTQSRNTGADSRASSKVAQQDLGVIIHYAIKRSCYKDCGDKMAVLSKNLMMMSRRSFSSSPIVGNLKDKIATLAKSKIDLVNKVKKSDKVVLSRFRPRFPRAGLAELHLVTYRGFLSVFSIEGSLQNSKVYG